MRINYYSRDQPPFPCVIDMPEFELEEWKLPTFAKRCTPKILASCGGWPTMYQSLDFVHACPEAVYRAGKTWLVQVRFELNPEFSSWTRYSADDFARLWDAEGNPPARDFDLRCLPSHLDELSPSDKASPDEFMAKCRDEDWRFWGIRGPISLLRLVRSLDQPRHTKLCLSPLEAAGLLWAEGYALPADLDPSWLDPPGQSWTGPAQSAVILHQITLPALRPASCCGRTIPHQTVSPYRNQPTPVRSLGGMLSQLALRPLTESAGTQAHHRRKTGTNKSLSF